MGFAAAIVEKALKMSLVRFKPVSYTTGERGELGQAQLLAKPHHVVLAFNLGRFLLTIERTAFPEVVKNMGRLFGKHILLSENYEDPTHPFSTISGGSTTVQLAQVRVYALLLLSLRVVVFGISSIHMSLVFLDVFFFLLASFS